MKIFKVINNNTVVTLDSNQKEVIIIGRGLGFGCKQGEDVDENKIQKRFILSDSKTQTRFQEVLLETPFEYVNLAEEIIEYAKIRLNKKLNDNIYVTLVDHISTSIDRYKENIRIKNVLLWEVKQFYKDEFAIGKFALERIKQVFDVEMWDDEAAFIGFT